MPAAPDPAVVAPAVAGPALALLFCAAATAPLGLNIIVPALPAIGQAFAAPQSAVQLTISLFLLLFGSMQLVMGPLSDRYGRRPVLLGAIALFVCASVWAALATSIASLVGARALQAVGGCAALVIPRAVVRDLHTGAAAVRAMALVSMAIAVVPAVAPLIGGLLLAAFGWTSLFMLCAGYGAVLLAWLWLAFPETLAPQRRSYERLPALARRYASLLRSRPYLAYTANFALVTVGFMLFVSVAPILLIRDLGISPAQYGLCHLLLGGAVVVGSTLAPRLAGRWGVNGALVRGSALAAVALAVLLALSGTLSVARLMGPILVYALANGVIFPLALTAATGIDPRSLGASAAFVGFVQMLFSAVAVFIVNQFPAATAPFAAFALICALLGLAALRGARRTAP
jgi:DHA1 family bicyclomycin/chloramphenicol resistance-like MFS transporter